MTSHPALISRGVGRWLTAAVAAFAAGALISADAEAQRNRDDESSAEGRVFTPDVGEIVVAAQEKMGQEPPDIQGALSDLNRAMNNEDPSPYELGVILYMRGSAKYQLEDTSGALADWNRALAEGDLSETERLNLMYNAGQLYLSEGNYREAVTRIEEWIRAGGNATDGVHLNLVAAYVELGEYSNALRHGREAYNKASPRQKRHYDTLNYLYTEMNMPAERAELLSEMVELFPQDKSVWLSIAALHAEAGREQKAFEINKIMYLNGMLTTESEIMRIVDYYSYYEVPYRGARILERELNAGRVERDQDNLEKLARLYRQSNEFDRAIPPLEAAARMAPDGSLFQTLGEAYYAEARLEEAETALLDAIDKGGLDNAGDVWVVIGNSRYEREAREEAIEAFEQGEQYQASRETAREWREFVEREINIQREQEEFKVNVQKEELRVSCERQISDIIIYEANREEGDPDCVAIVRRGDFSSVPTIVEAEAAIIAKYEGGDEVAVPGESDEDGESTETEAGR